MGLIFVDPPPAMYHQWIIAGLGDVVAFVWFVVHANSLASFVDTARLLGRVTNAPFTDQHAAATFETNLVNNIEAKCVAYS